MSDLIASPAGQELDRSIHPENNHEEAANNRLPPSLEASAELQFLYSYFNDRLFDGKLPHCMVVYTRKPRCFGYFAPDRFRNLDGQLVPELALNPTYLSVYGDIEAFKTMAHEQTHVAHYYFGPLNRNGRRPSNGYHCRNWGAIMRQIGLMPSNTGKPVGKPTGYQMMEYVIQGGLFEQVCDELLSSGFKLNWGDNVPSRTTQSGNGDVTGAEAVTPTKPTKKDRIKFTCPSCSLNAWAKPSATLACGTCSLIMTSPETKG